MTLVLVDCEAPFDVGSPAVGDMTEFGAVVYKTKESFHGTNCSLRTFQSFRQWLTDVCRSKPVFVSDNPAYDWQWINFYFWRYFHENPFGHSARRISDFYAGLKCDFKKTQQWKSFRKTKHDHNPVHDAMGNAEALEEIMRRAEIQKEILKQLEASQD